MANFNHSTLNHYFASVVCEPHVSQMPQLHKRFDVICHCMRHLLKFISVILLVSCMDKSHKDETLTVPEDSKAVTTTLRDSLGKVSFSIPAHFDTSFTWTNWSDCGKPCDHEQYRFQSKSFPIFKESGFYYDIPYITVEKFTIIHLGYFTFLI